MNGRMFLAPTRVVVFLHRHGAKRNLRVASLNRVTNTIDSSRLQGAKLSLPMIRSNRRSSFLPSSSVVHSPPNSLSFPRFSPQRRSVSSSFPIIPPPATFNDVDRDPRNISLQDAIEETRRITQQLFPDVRSLFSCLSPNLRELASYYFDGSGKAIRPQFVLLMACSVNQHQHGVSGQLTLAQKQVAMIAEMIHTASLLHDDVIDQADKRRGKRSANERWGQREAILAGDYVLGLASKVLAEIGDTAIVTMISQILMDLVQGEFMQMGSKQEENDRFTHYLDKTYKKTASLLANCFKAVAHLASANSSVQEAAFEVGRNLGIAFQLIDDLLDFEVSSEMLGKPVVADLRLGLATAPVLFACRDHPEMESMIMRRFSSPSDVAEAYRLVLASNGLHETRVLAQSYADAAHRHLSAIRKTPYRLALGHMLDSMLKRRR
ncbi:unnamed protein product [Cyprideis torosa]|uniref:Uncharacterized protein n=1 Tax=Cyprideis torosa TaxID=163714 RepID=A0A7R8ZNT7_9CRUS|nr:unnamed protein product [Cyprideis torosa]CAG0892340.1 unnamed protein product [Cyprideis torosa]